MRFDKDQYERDFMKKHRRDDRLPDDVLARYAITLPATDAEIETQVKAVRAYWTSKYQGTSTDARLAKMCRTEDRRLQDEHGARMETSAWWEQRKSQQQSAAEVSLRELSDDLRQKYGRLGVVTSDAIDRYAAKLGLTYADAARAADQAKLTLVKNVSLPGAPPIPDFPTLLRHMSEGGAESVPELIHPGATPFRLLDRYASTTCPDKRLDVVAVQEQMRELDKRVVSASVDARRAALRILHAAAKRHADLRTIALYHLVTIAREFVPLSLTRTVSELCKTGLERRDAAVIAVVLDDQNLQAGAATLREVQSLIGSGRLNEAKQAALNLPAESSDRDQAGKEVQEARERLDTLLAEARGALELPDEVQAAAKLREAAGISVKDAEVALASVPLPPPAQPHAVCEESTVKLFWQPAPGHDAATTYVTTRTESRPPVAPGDGTTVHRGSENACTDERAPVARVLHYGVFALADRRPVSRPAIVRVTLLPPVEKLEADVGPTEITVRWSAHPAAQEVRVTRSASGTPPAPVRATGNSCHLSGLTEGQAQRLELIAIYKGIDGAELRSPARQISATPRAEAQPIPELRVRPLRAAGTGRVRVAWTPIDNSEVRILRSATPPGWQFGTWISTEEMARFGLEVTGRQVPGRAEVTLEAELPTGIHHVVPFSIGGTGIVVGRPATVGVIEPVRHLLVTPFATYATLSWEWPVATQLAEVSWELGGQADRFVIGLGQYRSQGGARVPLGRVPYSVEVRAVVVADGLSLMSPPTVAVVASVLDTAIRYTVSSMPALGPFRGRSKRVIFSSDESCDGVHVRMVAAPGRVMPTSAEAGHTILDTALALKPGVPVERSVTVPRAVKRPYWVRCFVVAGRCRLIDPPISSLKEALWRSRHARSASGRLTLGTWRISARAAEMSSARKAWTLPASSLPAVSWKRSLLSCLSPIRTARP